MSKENDRTEPIVVTGFTGATGQFWADATLQVKKTTTSKWQSVGKSTGKGERGRITVAANGASGGFAVDFDGFKPFIMARETGRVILSTGATTQFTMDALTPARTGEKE